MATGEEVSKSDSDARIQDLVVHAVSCNPCVVFSKTTCPHCERAKACLDSTGARYIVIEIDRTVNPAAVAKALKDMTGRQTVPNVFIGGSSVGGADELAGVRERGELVAQLKAAGAIDRLTTATPTEPSQGNFLVIKS